jgi:NADH-quinone oxidoreductase subunit J
VIAISFYLLAFIAIASALMVVVARNPVHSVMFLIVTFFSAAGLFILMGAEFLALLLVMVYVGAVAVLFLFVVMMLDVDFVSLRSGFANNLPLGLIVASILLLELFLVGAAYFSDDGSRRVQFEDGKSNLERFGEVLYTEYAFFFEAAGIILLVAMVGAIGLTLRDRPNVRRQNAADQIARTREEGVELLDVPSGEGLG